MINFPKNITFNRIKANDMASPADYIAKKINEHLNSSNCVVWFISGGSNIPLAVETRKQLNLNNKSELHICLIDERFVPYQDKNSNWQQLIKAGFNTANVICHEVLSSGDNIEVITKKYNSIVNQLLKKADYKIGQFGLGRDGHTAGLLPHSPLMQSLALYDFYTAKDFERITVTPKIVSEFDDTILYVSGSEKQKAMHDLIDNGIIEEVPARILLNSKRLTIFSDVI